MVFGYRRFNNGVSPRKLKLKLAPYNRNDEKEAVRAAISTGGTTMQHASEADDLFRHVDVYLRSERLRLSAERMLDEIYTLEDVRRHLAGEYSELPKADAEATHEEIARYLRQQNSVSNGVRIEIKNPEDRLRKQGIIVSKKEREAALNFADEFLACERKKSAQSGNPHDLLRTVEYVLPKNVSDISYKEENRQNPGKGHFVSGFDLN